MSRVGAPKLSRSAVVTFDRHLLPPHVQIALWELDAWITDRTQLTQPGDYQRTAVVLAWCEHLFRAGPAALPPCPLLRLQPGDGPANLLDLVADQFVDQLTRLGQLAEAQLLTAWPDHSAVLLGCPLGRRPIAADTDLVLSGTLLELKCTKGGNRSAGPTFTLSVDLVRRLLGYVLPDQGDDLNVRSVGVYAARFGLLWSMPATELIATCGGYETDLAAARAAFDRLWHPA
jgi:hypothetical protein